MKFARCNVNGNRACSGSLLVRIGGVTSSKETFEVDQAFPDC